MVLVYVCTCSANTYTLVMLYRVLYACIEEDIYPHSKLKVVGLESSYPACTHMHSIQLAHTCITTMHFLCIFLSHLID